MLTARELQQLRNDGNDGAADEIERLRSAICIVREYPDFDDGGPLPEMLDQVLRGEPAPMLDALEAHARSKGTPVSQLSGRPGRPGFGAFSDIAASWGYD